MKVPTSKLTAPNFKWGQICEGWKLADSDGLSVAEERVPPGGSEVRHYHEKARQFFYVLSGEASLEVEGHENSIVAGWGIEVEPGSRHRFINKSDREVVFLVITAPFAKGDRINV